VDEHAVVKTLVMQDERAAPLVVLMHGTARSRPRTSRARSAQERRALLARGRAAPQRYLVGGTSPLRHPQGDAGVRRALGARAAADRINGGRRGFLVSVEPGVLAGPLGATARDCALEG
jgi:prolyl-tRNA editing enzyme YbaK/EbsC (Cys-tRNA(Pro) deacylase)